MNERPIDWSQLARHRGEALQRWPSIFDLPLIKKRSHLLRRFVADGAQVLDVGAGDRRLEGDLAAAGRHVTYLSMDVDRRRHHDLYDLDDVGERQFDLVALFEVVEHLGLEEGLALLRRSLGLTRPGGYLVVSTPNIYNPGRYMRDATHRTFYAHEELCAALREAGWTIAAAFRVHHDAFLRYHLKVHLFGFLFRFLSVDYAHSIVVVGRQEGAAGP
jgi:SAM-dependent methyltransferase